jgi:serine/threonine-protein kinase
VTDETRSRFEVVAQLAAGGTTNVFMCRLQGVAGFVKELAVKRLIPERAGPDEVRAMNDEGWVGAQLTHANIVQVFEVGEDAGRPYIAMEYVRGVSLAQVTARMAGLMQLDLGLGVQLLTGIASAVAYMHQATDTHGEPLGLVHRNVCPGNVVVSTGGMPKLIDFGLARTRHALSTTEAAQAFGGDLRYVAPEQLAGSSETRIDARADVFSLGVMLYELTCARNPFGPPGQSAREVHERILRGGYLAPSELVPGYPPELEQIVLSAMEPELERRCESARVFSERLEALAAAHGDVASPPAWAAWLRELFPELAHTPRPQLGMPWRTPAPRSSVAAGPVPAFSNLRTQRTESNRSVPATTPAEAEPATASNRTRWRWALALLGTGLAAAAAVVAIGSARSPATPPAAQDAQALVVTPPAVDARPAVDAGAAATGTPAPIVAPNNDEARRPARRSRVRKPAPTRKKTDPCS